MKHNDFVVIQKYYSRELETFTSHYYVNYYIFRYYLLHYYANIFKIFRFILRYWLLIEVPISENDY